MAVAIRIARAYTGRDKIAFCGYHGWHDWYLAANLTTEDALSEHLLAGLPPRGVPAVLGGTAFPFRYNRLDDLQSIVRQHGRDIAAIVMEPIRNHWPQTGFFENVVSLASECGAVFVIDEISAGFRMNSAGAHMILGVEPDIAVFSKAISNGYPMAAIIGKASVMQAAQSTFISSTSWTERIGPAASLATIRKHCRLDVSAHLMEIGRLVQDGWRHATDKHGLDIQVGGIPPLSHFTFGALNGMSLKAGFVQLMLKRGFLASDSFYAMWAHTQEHVNRYLGAVDESFEELAALHRAGRLEEMLIAGPAVAGFQRLA